MKVTLISELTDDMKVTRPPEDDSEPAEAENIRLATGIDILDRNLNGGIPPGALVYFSAYPKSMPEVFLYELSMPRKTFYVTTHKRPKYIKRHMEEIDFDTSNIEFVDVHGEYYGKLLPISQDKPEAAKKTVQYISDWLDMLNESGERNFTIIIDSFSFLLDLDIDIDTIKCLLDKIYDIVGDSDSVCYIMVVKGLHHESVESRVQYWCDVIFDIDMERKGDKIVNKLTLPKIRGMSPLTDYIKFKVTDRITIDTSRDIA